MISATLKSSLTKSAQTQGAHILQTRNYTCGCAHLESKEIHCLLERFHNSKKIGTQLNVLLNILCIPVTEQQKHFCSERGRKGGQQTFPLKAQTVNILSFAGHMVSGNYSLLLECGSSLRQSGMVVSQEHFIC